MKKYFSIYIYLLITNIGFGQTYFFGVIGGLNFNFGNKYNRIGVSCKSFLRNDYFQFNSELLYFYNISSLGLNIKSHEVQLKVGLLGGFKSQDYINEFISVSDKHINKKFAFGYFYSWYLDNIETTQSTGTIMINIDRFSIYTENDILGAGSGWRDRFRTGAVKFEYHLDSIKLSTNFVLWTGDYSRATKIMDTDYPARFGHYSQENAVFGNKTLGLFSIKAEYVMPYKQVVSLDIGLDSEKGRHFVQNKALHDMPFYTDKMVKRKLMHIPMLQEDGSQYLYKENQKIKPNSFYFNIGLNSGLFY